MIGAVDRSELETRIGYIFQNEELLITALTHSSYANEQDDGTVESNERFEFLGDALTGLEVALLIFEMDPYLSEGQMTEARASLVQTEGLAGAARAIGLGRYLRLGVGAERTGVRESEGVLENAFEALVAAVFLDGGGEAAREFVRRFFTVSAGEKVMALSGDGFIADYKSRLQETMQKNGAADIRYVLKDESGPDHDKTFCVNVVCDGIELGTGVGKTKKSAEKMAARIALEELKCI